jgi:CheY-like chemotaxis protein
MKVLVVDDSQPNLQLAAYLLERGGFEVRTATSASDAKAQFREFEPHLVLMDIQMPEVDGITAMKQLRADPHNSAVRFVAFTAYAMEGDSTKLLAAGFDGYIAKPIEVQRFIQQVEDAMRDAG